MHTFLKIATFHTLVEEKKKVVKGGNFEKRHASLVHPNKHYGTSCFVRALVDYVPYSNNYNPLMLAL